MRLRSGTPLFPTLLLGAGVAGTFALLTVFGLWHLPLLSYHFKGLFFIDWYAVSAASDAFSDGHPVFSHSPYDYFGRPHVYSGLWLHLAWLGLDRFDHIYVAAFLLVGFIAALSLIVAPKDRGDLLRALPFALSPPFLLAMERMNNDVVVFLVLAPLCLVHRLGRAGPPAATLLIAAATMLKFYPAVLFPLVFTIFGFSFRTFIWTTAGVLLAATQIILAGELQGPLSQTLPKPAFLFTFAGENLFSHYAGLPAGTASVLSITVGVSIVLITLLRLIPQIDQARNGPAPGRPNYRENAFLLGALVVVGCFMLRPGFSYRLIFAAFSLPAVISWMRDPAFDASMRQASRIWFGSYLAFTFIEPVALHSIETAISTGLIAPSPEAFLDMVTRLYLAIGVLQWVFVAAYIYLAGRIVLFHEPLAAPARAVCRLWSRTPAKDHS